ncbi:penicillin-binding protein activator [Alteraurantiacibacter palmitatis]|uniref:Penicillin-binding protein activator n=1 Tax=Alteraurantiacibacter palmitatis TaxID=2054628 RepID=A0ABV7E1E4_9SPHN
MIGNLRRGLALALLTIVLAGCRVIPDDGGVRPGTTAPVEQPTDLPDAGVLPQDQGRHRVALLVPLSGENGAVGQSIANATTMALLDTNAENLRITTYDTAAGAALAASRAVSDGNRLILGPLVRDDVSAVLAQARPAGVPLITFSNDAGIAGADVFVMGLVPEQSVERTVRFAIDQGARRFAALVPQGEFGQRMAAALRRTAERGGANLVAVETYGSGANAVTAAAARLNRQGGFDTVLIGDGPRMAVIAANELKQAGADLPSLIGPELWSGDTTLPRTASLRGAWFSSVSDARYRQFATSYETRFGNQPYRVATLGYDAVLLTLRVAREWTPGRPFPVQQMLDPDGFLGLDGAFRFRADGVGERVFEVREIGNGAVSVVDPAPRQF